MGQLRDKKTGATYDVSDSEAVAAARENPNLEIVGSIRVSPTKEVREGGYLAKDTWSDAASTAESSRYWHQRHVEDAHDTIGSRAKAFAGGAVSMLDAGLWKPWSEDQEAHPYIAGAGGIAALVPSLFSGGGEAAVAGKVGAEALEAGKAVTALTRTERSAAGLGRAYEFSAPGIASRAMRAAEGVVPEAIAGSKAIGNVTRTAAGGAAFSTTDELLRQALDPDREFSGEQLLHSAAWGGALAGGGSLLAEGIGAGRSAVSKLLGRDSKSVDEVAMLGEHAPREAPSFSKQARRPWEERVDLSRSPAQVKVRDGIVSLRDDLERLRKIGTEVLENPGIRQASRLSRFELEPLVDATNMATKQLQRMMVNPEAPIEQLAANLHSADTLGQRLRSVTDQLPKRWADDAARSHFWSDLESRMKALPEGADPHLVAAERLSAHLSAGMSAAESNSVREGIFGLVGKQLLGGKLGNLAKGGLVGGGAVLLGEHLIDGVAGSIVKGALGVAALKTGAPLAAKAIQAAFRDPAVGGLIGGSTTSVLDRAHVLSDEPTRRNKDSRRSLRNFSERTRRVSPEHVASRTADSLAHMAGSTPMSVASAADTAARRHRYILAMLDREDPPAQGPLGRPLPSAASAKRVADAVRGLASPNSFVIAALNGTLTPSMLAAAETVYPATVQRMRQALLSQLAGVDPLSLPAATRRLVTMLLGPLSGGDTSGRAAYRSAMDESAQRTAQGSSPTQARPPASPPGPVSDNPLSSPSQRAIHPAGGR